jgi:succinyl-diaminopimelate desuccinylase
MTTALEIARALIACPSVTPREGGALDYLEGLLKSAGFITTRLPFSESGTPDVDNLYARFGTGAPHLCFAGHTDVVPPGDEAKWSHPPFAAEIADGKLYGRGAADMKGGVAAFAAAALDFVKTQKIAGSISFLITGDEEGPAINGTVKMLDWLKANGEKIDHCIVGEPTNPNTLGDMIKIGRRGSLNGDITVTGVQGHSAYPDQAVNPIEILAKIVTALTQKPLDSGTAHFSPTRLVVTSVDVANRARNVIPQDAKALFNVRFNDTWTYDTLCAEIARRIAQAAPGGEARVDFLPSNSPSFRTEPGAFTDLVARAIEEITGRKPELSTSGGTSDARFIAAHCPVLEFGLVGKTIHATDEHIEIADLQKLADIYGAILNKYFGKKRQ